MAEIGSGYPSIDMPWMKYYDEDKRDFTLPDCSVYDFMLQSNAENLSATALDYFGKEFSYRELISMIDQCACAFNELGIRRGDVVSFCNPTTPEMYFAFYALNKLGAIANMIDPRTNASRIEEFITRTHSSIVFFIDIAYPKIRDILAKNIVKKAICISAADSLPALLRFGYRIKNRSVLNNEIPKSGKYLEWKQFFTLGKKERSGENKRLYEKAIELPAGIIYTSGTTGVPKGAILTNKNLISMVFQNKCADMGWEKNDRFLGIMPPFIAYGLVCGFTLPLCLGMRVTIIPKFEIEQFDSYILKYRPHHVMGVPSYIERLMNSKIIQKADLGFLKTVIVGGDKMNVEAEVSVNRFLKAHNSNCRVIKGYGLSEMSSNAVFPTCAECNKIGSVGIPLVKNNLKIIDFETGKELGYNEVGEICLTGPTLIDGYWDNEEENRKVFKIEDGLRWIHTGDRGYIDEDGVVFFNDRLKRIIVRSDGHNVWPSDSERIIERHPCIDSCCVVGVKDETAAGQGEIVTAFIVLKRDSKKSAEQVIAELKEECLKNLPTRDVPLQYFVRPELPLSGVGKIDYRALAELSKKAKNS